MIEYDFNLKDPVHGVTDMRNVEFLDLSCADINLNVSLMSKTQSETYLALLSKMIEKHPSSHLKKLSIPLTTYDYLGFVANLS